MKQRQHNKLVVDVDSYPMKTSVW